MKRMRDSVTQRLRIWARRCGITACCTHFLGSESLNFFGELTVYSGADAAAGCILRGGTIRLVAGAPCLIRFVVPWPASLGSWRLATATLLMPQEFACDFLVSAALNCCRPSVLPAFSIYK